MPETSLEVLFRRYATRGDVRALGEVFDRAAGELLVIAAHLARNPLQAEDLVQQAFVGAIESARRYDPRRPLMPWLVSILTRSAHYRMRQEARRVEPDRLGWMPPAPDPHRASEDAELRDAVSGALERVPSTYREVLRRHLAGGEAPREIASALGQAPGTVRVQLHRGLEHLRRALPPSFAVGAVGAALPTRGLAMLRAEVLASASSAKTVTAGSLITSRVLAGRVAATLAVLAIVAGSFLALARGGGSASAPSVAPLLERGGTRELSGGTRLAGAPAAPEENRLASDLKSDTEPKPATRTKPRRAPTAEELGLAGGEEWILRGQMIYTHRIDLTRTQIAVLRGEQVLASGAADDHGVFELDLPGDVGESGRLSTDLVVCADHPDFAMSLYTVKRNSAASYEPPTRDQPQRWVVGAMGHLKLPAATLDGSIEFGGGNAHVALFRDRGRGVPDAGPVDQAPLLGGAYTLRVPQRGEYILIATAEGWLPSHRQIEVQGELGDRILVEPIALERGRTLPAHVTLPAGTSPEGVRVALTPLDLTSDWKVSRATLNWRSLAWCKGRPVRLRREARVDHLGWCTFDSIPPIDLRALALDVPGLDPEDEPEIATLNSRDSHLELVPPVASQCFCVTGQGGALKNARLAIHREGRPALSLTTNQVGLASCLLPARSRFSWQVSAEGHQSGIGATQAPPPGQNHTRRLVLKPAIAALETKD